ncbi:MAG: aminoacyl-tRNA hydrolase [Thermodesulfovibrionales bacterium]|nr:aminoacyl-tRNA hydrolase [Thermodesulfovibrionales bacterium]
MWIIAGLGNPGTKYARTRHNIGFMVAEELAARYGIALRDRKGYRTGRGLIEGQDAVLIEPLLYMNASGPVIREMFRKYPAGPETLIVLHDDLDMDTGKIRIRKTGSSGGHRGIESIIANIGSKDFIRVKIGIGRGHDIPSEEYVLRKFTRQEIHRIKEALIVAADAVSMIVSDGVEKAMNKFN